MLGPAMAMQEIGVYSLACKRVRGRMLRAAGHADIAPRKLSFKQPVQLWLAWRHDHPASGQQEIIPLALVALRRVGRRPGRREPRTVKRRSKPYRLPTQVRPDARKHVRAHRHPVRARQLPFGSGSHFPLCVEGSRTAGPARLTSDARWHRLRSVAGCRELRRRQVSSA